MVVGRIILFLNVQRGLREPPPLDDGVGAVGGAEHGGPYLRWIDGARLQYLPQRPQHARRDVARRLHLDGPHEAVSLVQDDCVGVRSADVYAQPQNQST